MVNTWTGNGTPRNLAAAPDHGAHKEWPSGASFYNKINTAYIGNRGTKQQVRGAPVWKKTPPEHNTPHTKVTESGSLFHWCPHHNLWTKHKPDECQIRPDPDQDQGAAPKGTQKENF
jgi:hypothetical protein